MANLRRFTPDSTHQATQNSGSLQAPASREPADPADLPLARLRRGCALHRRLCPLRPAAQAPGRRGWPVPRRTRTNRSRSLSYPGGHKPMRAQACRSAGSAAAPRGVRAGAGGGDV